ncbi:hypothetical protein AMECASPLE_021068 [Ameca splendens]|uniref:Uncharacterized protein n=1 Tax=Ameca splendens TaxID=208324 RepID=A0ABV1ACE8_9TELE
MSGRCVKEKIFTSESYVFPPYCCSSSYERLPTLLTSLLYRGKKICFRWEVNYNCLRLFNTYMAATLGH